MNVSLMLGAVLALIILPICTEAQFFQWSRETPRIFDEALTALDGHYANPLDFGVLRLAAVRDLRDRLPEAQLTVVEPREASQVTCTVGGEAGTRLALSGTTREGTLRDLTVLYEAIRKVAPRLEPALIEAAIIKALVGGLEAAEYLDRDRFREAQAPPSGRFGGVGLEITKADAHLVIITPIEGSPAAQAGLVPGERITAIDGVPASTLDLLEAVRRVRGPVGSQVTLVVQPIAGVDSKTVVLTRAQIQFPLPVIREREDGIVYVRLRTIQERTAADVKTELNRFQAAGRLKGILLDLRNNPGAPRLIHAVEFGGLFLPTNTVLFTAVARTTDRTTEYATVTQGAPFGAPLVVLVNGGSGGSAEAIAGALQDHGRAAVVGKRTAGVAATRILIPLSDGSGLRLASAWLVTPKGRKIQGAGIIPDVVIDTVGHDTSGGAGDSFFEGALQVLRKRIDSLR